MTKKSSCLKNIVKTVTGFEITDPEVKTIRQCLEIFIEKCGSEKDLTGKTNCELLHELNEVLPEVINAGDVQKYEALKSGTIELSFPASLTTIKEKLCYAFQSMTKVTMLGVTSIEKQAFFGCGRLSNLTLNEGLLTIGDEAFSSCSSLQNIEIPSTVTSLGNNVFQNSGVKNITFTSETPATITATTFADMWSLQKIIVPDDSVDTYKAAENWSTYAEKIVGESEAE